MTNRSPATRKRGVLRMAVLCAPLDEVLAVEDEALPVEVPLPEEPEEAAAARVEVTTAEVAETEAVAVPSSTWMYVPCETSISE